VFTFGEDGAMDGFGGKVAAVTGAGSGIGRALALELARSGARLAISDVDTDGLAQTEKFIPRCGQAIASSVGRTLDRASN